MSVQGIKPKRGKKTLQYEKNQWRFGGKRQAKEAEIRLKPIKKAPSRNFFLLRMTLSKFLMHLNVSRELSSESQAETVL